MKRVLLVSPWKHACMVRPDQAIVWRSAEELVQLQNAELAASVKRERLRLARLHSHLFEQPGPGSLGREPAVSLESFVWAHCLVRSRALDLTADQARPMALLLNLAGGFGCFLWL